MILLDTSFLVGALNTRDAHHDQAHGVMGQIEDGRWGPAILPEYVFTETVTVLAARRDQRMAGCEGRRLLHNEALAFLPCGPYFSDAWHRFRRQGTSRFSFVDAALLAVATERGVEHIATFDRDFLDVPGLEVVPAS